MRGLMISATTQSINSSSCHSFAVLCLLQNNQVLGLDGAYLIRRIIYNNVR